MDKHYAEKAVIMDEASMGRAIRRIAHEIVERNKGAERLALIGIQRRGVPLAERIAVQINEIERTNVKLGVLDITFYRDDLSLLAAHPVVNGTSIAFPLEGCTVILVDDVIYTGRTVRAAIEALFDSGRPDMVQLAVMVDRGHRELPFKPDYIGKNVPTSKSELVSVELTEVDGRDLVSLKALSENA